MLHEAAQLDLKELARVVDLLACEYGYDAVERIYNECTEDEAYALLAAIVERRKNDPVALLLQSLASTDDGAPTKGKIPPRTRLASAPTAAPKSSRIQPQRHRSGEELRSRVDIAGDPQSGVLIPKGAGAGDPTQLTIVSGGRVWTRDINTKQN